MSTTVFQLPQYKKTADIFPRYAGESMAVWLDSALENQLGRYSVIGLHPYRILKEEQGKLFVNGHPQEGSIEACLSAFLAQEKEAHDFPLPLIAGAIGYFSYDYGRKFEAIPSANPKSYDIPDALFVFYDNLIIEDIHNEKLYVTARGELAPAKDSIEALVREIESSPAFLPPPKNPVTIDFQADFEKKDYKKTIEKMISYIESGDIYITNMTQQLSVQSENDPFSVYCYLRTHNPAPFGGYFQYDDFQIAGASMERFLQVKDGQVETRPIKGTRPRGKTPEEDEAYRRELEESEKDHSELLMVVDLERNDLNHVCQAGSVKVTKHFEIEEYATVFHLVTTVVGTLEEGKDNLSLIEAAFPGGSITGTPKIRAMEIIDELEHHQRGLYTGSMGYFSLDGSCDFNIVIRTALHKDGMYYLGVGGGITCESEPQFEYEETLQKAKAVLEAIANGKEAS